MGDAHTHIQNVQNPPQLFKALMQRSVDTIVVCATNPADWPAVLEFLSRDNPFFHVAIGIHPWWSTSTLQQHSVTNLRERLDALLLNNNLVSIGEIGLDHSKRALAKTSWDDQVQLFHMQLELAYKHSRPVSVHCVQCQKQMLEVLSQTLNALYPSQESLRISPSEVSEHPKKGIRGFLMHSWGGNLASARSFQAEFKKYNIPYCFSFQGSVAIRGNNMFLGALLALFVPDSYIMDLKYVLRPGSTKDVVKCLETLSLDEIVFETDSPDQPFHHLLHPAYKRYLEEAVFSRLENDSRAQSRLEEWMLPMAEDTSNDGKKEGEATTTSECVDATVTGTEGCCPSSTDASTPLNIQATSCPSQIHYVIASAALIRVAAGIDTPEGSRGQGKIGKTKGRDKNIRSADVNRIETDGQSEMIDARGIENADLPKSPEEELLLRIRDSLSQYVHASGGANQVQSLLGWDTVDALGTDGWTWLRARLEETFPPERLCNEFVRLCHANRENVRKIFPFYPMRNTEI